MGQIIVQAIVTVMTGGTGTAATQATMEAAIKTAVNAAIKNLVRQALTQLITAAITGNSLKLDLDSMVKGAVKAGVVSYADSFIDLKVVDHDTTKLAQNIQNTVLTTGVETAVYGGSYIDNLKNNSLNQISAETFKYIGHESAIKDNLPAKTVIHSLVGGAIAKLKGGDFSAGAIATATGHVVGEYVKKELQNKPNASLQDIENIITKAKAISSVVSGAVTIQAKGDISNKDLAISQEMSKSVVENNNLRLLITLAKVGRKIYKIGNKLNVKKLKKIFKEEGMDIADDVMTLLDGDITVDDAFALADLVIGTDLNSKKSRSLRFALQTKRYIRDIEKITGRKLPAKQLRLLKEDLQNNKYSRLSVSEVKANRKAFTSSKKNKLIKEWERNTGQKWPKETYTNNSGKILTRYYDAHHIVEVKFGGKHEWWNIHPAKNGIEHQGKNGIHRVGGPAHELFGR